MELERIGFTGDEAQAVEDYVSSAPDADARQGAYSAGRVARVDRGECDVITAEGTLRVASDSLRAQRELAPATGDWVVIDRDHEAGPVIAHILPRRSAMVRRDPSERVEEQVLVSNTDLVGIVQPLDQEVNLARIERYLVLAVDSGSRPVVVLTKADVLSDDAVRRARTTVGEVTDAPVVATSSVNGEGVNELRELLGNQTIVLVGPSGAGKSSLANEMIGEQRQAVAAVREGDAKGRHTTVTRDLIPLDGGGVLIDTPGIRAVGIWEADEALDSVFGDVAEVAADCRFGDCTHRQEPGCAVRSAVAEGELDADRVERYQNLWAEISNQSDAAERRAWSSRRRP